MKTAILIIILAALHPVRSIAQSDSTEALQEAVRIAEQYICVNGFTSEMADTAKMSPEFLYDDDLSKTAVAKKRRNMLHPKAFCWSVNRSDWHIGFLSTKVDLDRLTPEKKNQNLPGKVVIIAKDPSEIRMAHKNALFSKWRKL